MAYAAKQPSMMRCVYTTRYHIVCVWDNKHTDTSGHDLFTIRHQHGRLFPVLELLFIPSVQFAGAVSETINQFGICFGSS